MTDDCIRCPGCDRKAKKIKGAAIFNPDANPCFVPYIHCAKCANKMSNASPVDQHAMLHKTEMRLMGNPGRYGSKACATRQELDEFLMRHPVFRVLVAHYVTR